MNRNNWISINESTNVHKTGQEIKKHSDYRIQKPKLAKTQEIQNCKATDQRRELLQPDTVATARQPLGDVFWTDVGSPLPADERGELGFGFTFQASEENIDSHV